MRPMKTFDDAAPLPARWRAAANRLRRGPAAHSGARSLWTLQPETLLVLFSLFWALSANIHFLKPALAGHALADPATWALALALVIALVAVHALLLGLLCHSRATKPLLAALTVGTAAAGFYIGRFGVYLDPSMLRNLLRTDVAEASELLSLPLTLHLALFAGLPLALLWRVQLAPRRSAAALGRRLLLLVAALALLLGAVLSVYQPMSSLMRNHKELRYRITPANLMWSGGAVLAADARGAALPRQPVAQDATPGPSWAQRRKPLLLVLVLGETTRAADWGLAGGPRPTTPALRALRDAGQPIQDFGAIRACGTSTEVSLPCMFSAVGRRDYDEARIRGQDSLLHVAARAGVQVHWVDNQSGCKGVCEGLPTTHTAGRQSPQCAQGRCLDEELLSDLDRQLEQAQGTQLLVLHLLGSHGPAYFRRYPPAFARFQPACQNDDLARCTAAEVANAYANSVLYTDHVLARAINRLQAHQDQVDSALVFVSDHGESLGEHGLFLHGLPYAIAPDVQTRVPMVTWFSPGLEAASGLRPGCLRPALARRAAAVTDDPVTHDHLFHTVLGLLDVQTQAREASLNLVQGCAAWASSTPATRGVEAIAAARLGDAAGHSPAR